MTRSQLILLGEDGPHMLYARNADSASEGIAGDRALEILDSIEPQVLESCCRYGFGG